NTTGVDGHHGLAGFAAEGLAKFRHVLDNSVDAELVGRVGVGLNLKASGFWPGVIAPVLAVGEKELLNRVVAVLLLVEVNVLAFGVFKEGHVGETDAAI